MSIGKALRNMYVKQTSRIDQRDKRPSKALITYLTNEPPNNKSASQRRHHYGTGKASSTLKKNATLAPRHSRQPPKIFVAGDVDPSGGALPTAEPNGSFARQTAPRERCTAHRVDGTVARTLRTPRGVGRAGMGVDPPMS